MKLLDKFFDTILQNKIKSKIITFEKKLILNLFEVMNLIEHLTAPTIGFYCLDIAPFDVEMFHEQITSVLLIGCFCI